MSGYAGAPRWDWGAPGPANPSQKSQADGRPPMNEAIAATQGPANKNPGQKSRTVQRARRGTDSRVNEQGWITAMDRRKQLPAQPKRKGSQEADLTTRAVAQCSIPEVVTLAPPSDERSRGGVIVMPA